MIIIIFLLEFFLIQPYVKKIYLKQDIENFREFQSWKVYFAFWILIFSSFIIFKKSFSYKKLLIVVFYFCFLFLFFQRFLTNSSLYINQLYKVKSERKIYKLYNDKKYLQLFLDNEKDKEYIVDEVEINKINAVREKKNLKRVQDLPTHDSVCVDYKVGIFDVKYLK